MDTYNSLLLQSSRKFRGLWYKSRLKLNKSPVMQAAVGAYCIYLRQSMIFIGTLLVASAEGWHICAVIASQYRCFEHVMQVLLGSFRILGRYFVLEFIRASTKFSR